MWLRWRDAVALRCHSHEGDGSATGRMDVVSRLSSHANSLR